MGEKSAELNPFSTVSQVETVAKRVIHGVSFAEETPVTSSHQRFAWY
jgi:hypothetical protein